MTTSANGGRVREKLSIYPQAEQELVLVETNTALEQRIATARLATTSTYRHARARVQGVVDRWIGVENAVEKRVKSLIPVDESLTPGVLYVGVATLTASILARNRSFLLRFSLPPALFLISMNHFLPKTSHNISSYLSSLERAHAPALADTHERLNQNIASTSASARQTWDNTRSTIVGGVERTVTELQDRTGLKLREIFSLGQESSGNVKAGMKDTAERAEKTGKDPEE